MASENVRRPHKHQNTRTEVKFERLSCARIWESFHLQTASQQGAMKTGESRLLGTPSNCSYGPMFQKASLCSGMYVL